MLYILAINCLYIFKLNGTKLCSFCNEEDETIICLLTALKVKPYGIA